MITAVPPLLANIVGFIGAACCLCAYAYGTMTSAINPLILHGFNLAGAVLLTMSLLVETNPASLVMECAWGVIASVGLIRALRKSRRKHP